MENMSGKTANRLIGEKSPYLRQHAYNPVSWYPWGQEAFEEAARTDRPVFLSIGYSTCHWCHVMEKESFADQEIARLMNETFISIKVDREERPDLDGHYMAVCQLLTGGGGWPLTVILTPDKRPFFAGTYFPKESRFGLVGLKELIGRTAEAWKSRRSELLSATERVLTELAGASEGPGEEKLSILILDRAASQLAAQFDNEFGGFGSAPKFPTPHHLSFLLRQARRKHDKNALAIVERTLQAMHRGGIFDQLGFGFHRYSTDRRWLVPHFEKMLYDQALLAMAYTEAFQFTGRDEYRQTVEEIVIYVNRDLRSPEGAFYTAEDADSEGEEGKFYVWELGEIEAFLASDEARSATEIFDLKPEGNFAGPGGRPSGKNILHLARLPDPAARLGVSEEELLKLIARLRGRLFGRREERPRPLKDTKILTDWNGLMIAALAKGAQAFGRADYAGSAALAADYIRKKMTVGGRLYHRSAEGEVTVPAFLDDHAFLIWGLLELYGATLDPGYLSWAAGLTEDLIRSFWDEKDGAFFFTSSDFHKDLPFRRKEGYDGALPSGNSVMMSNLLRLGRALGRADLEARAEKIGQAFSGKVTAYPAGYTQLLCGLDFAFGPAREVVIVGRRESSDTQAMLKILGKEFLPNTVMLFRPAEEGEPEIVRLAPFTAEMKSLGDKATAYVCSKYRCDRPVTEPEELRSLLD
jgi:uncharacterized protein YyaL (SSP411 family)